MNARLRALLAKALDHYPKLASDRIRLFVHASSWVSCVGARCPFALESRRLVVPTCAANRETRPIALTLVRLLRIVLKQQIEQDSAHKNVNVSFMLEVWEYDYANFIQRCVMNTLSPYLLRCFDINMAGAFHSRHPVLDKVGKNDTFLLLKNFIDVHSKDFLDVPDEKQVFRFNSFSFDLGRRVAAGWLEAGHYGVRSDIINVQTGGVDFQRAMTNAEITRHFIFIFMPLGFNEATALLHSCRGNGVKSLFFSQFGAHFQRSTNLNLQMNPMAYEKAFSHWVDGQAKELRLVRFKGLADMADQLKQLGHEEQELRIKAPRKGSLGRLKDYLTAHTEQAKAVEILSPLCTQIRTVVEVEGRKRTFHLGPNANQSICQIEAPDDIELVDGNPTLATMEKWSLEVAREFVNTMYPGLKVPL